MSNNYLAQVEAAKLGRAGGHRRVTTKSDDKFSAKRKYVYFLHILHTQKGTTDIEIFIKKTKLLKTNHLWLEDMDHDGTGV